MDPTKEKTRKDWWLAKLKDIHPGWKDGDLISRIDKTVDFLNRETKVAIELKIEQGDHLDDQIGNVETLSNRIEDYFDSASKKFKSYPPTFKTILIIELSSPMEMAQSVLSGALRTVSFSSGGPTSTWLRNEGLFSKLSEHIGTVVFWPTSGTKRAYYFNNREANAQRKVSKNGVERVIGSSLEIMDLRIGATEGAPLNKGFEYWLRWLAVLPGALLSGVIALFPLRWVLYSTLSTFVDPYPELPERFLSPFVTAAVFVWAGSRIAPERKIETSVILFGLWLFLLGGFVFLTLSGAGWVDRQLYFQGRGIAPVMSAVGALAGLYIARRFKGNS